MKNTKIIIPIAVLGLLGVLSYAGIKSVSAETSRTYPPLVQKIIEKFGLNEEEVSKVVEEYRSENQGNRLDEAVANGKITSEQKDKILAKMEELQKENLNFQDMTQEERRTQMETHRAELEKWAEDNGIDASYIMGFGKGPHMGKGSGMMGSGWDR